MGFLEDSTDTSLWEKEPEDWLNFATQVKALWRSDGAQKAWQTRFELAGDDSDFLHGSTQYLIENVDRICGLEFTPTDADYLILNEKYGGIQQIQICIKGNNFHFVEMERGSVHAGKDFYNIYFADLTSFSRSCNGRNELQEVVEDFKAAVNSAMVQKRSRVFILLLNFDDLFPACVKSRSITDMFPEFQGDPTDEIAVKNFIKDLFRAAYSLNGKWNLFVHHTSCFDIDRVEKIFKDIQNVIIHSTLRKAGLIDSPSTGIHMDQKDFEEAPQKEEESEELEREEQVLFEKLLMNLENYFYGHAYYYRRFVMPSMLVIPLYAILSFLSTTFVVLPSCFVLLAVGFNHVEADSTKQQARGEELDIETTAKKRQRLYHLLGTSTSVNAFIIGYPFIFLYWINSQHELVFSIYFFLIISLQCLGTYRSFVSHHAKALKHNYLRMKRIVFDQPELPFRLSIFNQVSSKYPPEWRTTNVVDPDCVHNDWLVTHIDGRAVSWDNEDILLNRIRNKNFVDNPVEITFGIPPETRVFQASSLPADILKCILLIFEAGQIAYYVHFAYTDNESVSTPEWLRILLFLRMDTNDNLMCYSLLAFGAVIITFILVAWQFHQDVAVYATTSYGGDEKSAREYLFRSFVGTCMYGHMNLDTTTVPFYIKMLITIFTDYLYILIFDKLVGLFLCSNGKLLLDDNVVCWESHHRLYATFGLICIGFYIPLCTLCAPLFDPYSENRISETLPYKGLLIIAKSILIFWIIVNDLEVFGILYILICVAVVACTLWLTISQSNEDPMHPPAACYFRAGIYVSGILGAIVALSTSSTSDFHVLIPCCLIFGISITCYSSRLVPEKVVGLSVWEFL